MFRTHRPAALTCKGFLIASCLAFRAAAGAHAADNWPDYRGPTADGHTSAESLPLSWSEKQNIKWKTAIPGKGWSSPIIWGEQVWMTTANDSGTERFAICVDKNSGAIVHNIKVFDVSKPESLNDLNSYASPTVAVEEGRVYVHFGTQGTACLDSRTGKILWQRRDLKINHHMGPGSSPVLFKDTLIVHCDGTDQQYIVAFNKNTGETAWKTPRTADFSKVIPFSRKSFDTPVFTQVKDHLELISVAGQAVYGYDPDSGRELWRFGYKGYSNAFRPVVAGDLVIFATCYDQSHIEAFRLGGSGDITSTNLAWKYMKNAPYKTSPILLDGLLYMISDAGIATCLEAGTGVEVWKERIGGEFSASPLYAKGRIYFFDHAGKTTVIEPGRQFKVLATSKLDDGFMASPAVTGNALILRTKTHLYRIEN